MLSPVYYSTEEEARKEGKAHHAKLDNPALWRAAVIQSLGLYTWQFNYLGFKIVISGDRSSTPEYIATHAGCPGVFGNDLFFPDHAVRKLLNAMSEAAAAGIRKFAVASEDYLKLLNPNIDGVATLIDAARLSHDLRSTKSLVASMRKIARKRKPKR